MAGLLQGQIALWNAGGAGSQALVDIAKDSFGFSILAQKRNAQTQALTNPQQYLTERNNRIAHLENRIATNWATNVATFVTSGVATIMQGTNVLVPRIPPMAEAVAKDRATKESLAEYEAGMRIIDLEYPLEAVSVAVGRQHNVNARTFADGAEISGKSVSNAGRKRGPLSAAEKARRKAKRVANAKKLLESKGHKIN